MKIEISYKNSLIGSLSAGESLALHLTDQKLTEDLIVRAVGDATISNFVLADGSTFITSDGNIFNVKEN